MIPVNKLIEKFQQAYTERWGYIWGAAGSIWTASDQAYADKMYNLSVANNDGKGIDRWEMTHLYGKKWINRKVADCQGLFAWSFKELGGKIAHGSNSIWKDYLVSKGELVSGKRKDQKTLKPGTAVFKVKNGTDYYHIGLYAGNSKVIEAQGTQTGVVISSISKWHAWGELKGINYEQEAIPMDTYKKATVTANGGVNFRSQPSVVANRIATIPQGTAIEALEHDNTWSKAIYNGDAGFVMTKYITFDGQEIDDNGDALKLIDRIIQDLTQLRKMLQA